MALEICHASEAQDIEDAKLALVSLSLSSYREENVTDCLTEGSNSCKSDMQLLCQLVLHPRRVFPYFL